jgi:hypothetical protein
MYRIENTTETDITLPNGVTVRAGRAVGIEGAAWDGMSSNPVLRPRVELGHLTAKKIKEPVADAADSKPAKAG